MTTPVLEKLTDVQTSVVDTIASVKEPVVKGVTVVVDFVVERAPEMPVIPFAEQVPTPAELINNQYKFAKSILDTNKDIAVAVAKAASPITDKVLDRKAKAAKKATTAEQAA
jgi:hypothetical protein